MPTSGEDGCFEMRRAVATDRSEAATVRCAILRVVGDRSVTDRWLRMCCPGAGITALVVRHEPPPEWKLCDWLRPITDEWVPRTPCTATGLGGLAKTRIGSTRWTMSTMQDTTTLPNRPRPPPAQGRG